MNFNKLLLILVLFFLSLFLTCSPSVSPFQKPYKIVYKSEEKVFQVGVPVELDTPVVGGNKPITFRIAPLLPLGLNFDTATGMIYGTPKDTISRTSFAITAINSFGTFTKTIYITILPEPPKNLKYSLDTAIYFVNIQIKENKPSFSGGTPTKYECKPSLPAGLKLDAVSGIIYGTPEKYSDQSGYTITASNSGGLTQKVIVIKVDSALVSPSNFNAVRIDSTRVFISWERVPSAEYYLIYRLDVSGSTLIKALSDTFYIDSIKFNCRYFVLSKTDGIISQVKDTINVLDTITKTFVNHPPVFISKLDIKSIAANQTDTIIIAVKDVDTNQSIKISISNLDSLKNLFLPDTNAIRMISSYKDTLKIIFSPQTKSGTYNFEIIATDGIDTIKATITEYVGNVNRPPQWTTKKITSDVKDGDSIKISLKDSCSDADNDSIKFYFIKDSIRASIINNSLLIFEAGYLDTTLSYKIKVVATDGKLFDTLEITISIIPVYYNLLTSCENGRIVISPAKERYRLNEQVELTAIANNGYDFTGWSGSVSSRNNPLELIIDNNKTVTANFERYSEEKCNELLPGSSINEKIKELSLLPGASLLCPKEGKYDGNTIEIEGKITVNIKGIY